jgi:hypothetical protein
LQAARLSVWKHLGVPHWFCPRRNPAFCFRVCKKNCGRGGHRRFSLKGQIASHLSSEFACAPLTTRSPAGRAPKQGLFPGKAFLPQDHAGASAKIPARGRLDGWQAGWMAGCLAGSQASWMDGWMAVWLVGWMDDRQTGRQAGKLEGWQAGWMDGWQAGWMAARQAGSQAG